MYDKSESDGDFGETGFVSFVALRTEDADLVRRGDPTDSNEGVLDGRRTCLGIFGRGGLFALPLR